ncbi:hypothetical protein [uncultured Draconibacterium sp.]|uniref:hypothetical protein n=1 Tax=uncultured Draconibacterium sp. TaxID=1573823 RepID=UPI00321678FC
MKKVLLITAVLVLGVAAAVKAQDTDAAAHKVSITVPSINLVDVENASGENASVLTWTLDASSWITEAGDFNTTLSNPETFYLQYTSVVNKNKSHKITAELTTSDLPSAFELQLKTAESTNNSKKGKVGKGSGDFQALSKSSATEIVSGIKTAYTGTAAKDGHALNYQLVINPNDKDFGDLEADEYNVTVTYTITE